MPDIFTPAKRSAVMAAIRGKGNRDTELRLMALMRAHGITGWRRGVALTGKPDFVFRREKVAVLHGARGSCASRRGVRTRAAEGEGGSSALPRKA